MTLFHYIHLDVILNEKEDIFSSRNSVKLIYTFILKITFLHNITCNGSLIQKFLTHTNTKKKNFIGKYENIHFCGHQSNVKQKNSKKSLFRKYFFYFAHNKLCLHTMKNNIASFWYHVWQKIRKNLNFMILKIIQVYTKIKRHWKCTIHIFHEITMSTNEVKDKVHWNFIYSPLFMEAWRRLCCLPESYNNIVSQNFLVVLMKL